MAMTALAVIVDDAVATGPTRIAQAPAIPAAGVATTSSPTPQSKPVDAPNPVTAAEARYFAELDKAIAGVRDWSPAAEDLQRVREVHTAIAARDLIRARLARDAIQDPTGQRLADWLRLRAGYGEIAELKGFLEAEPDWPNRHILQRRLEEQVFTTGGAPSAIRAHLAGQPPEGGAGLAALASAALAEGKTEEARALAAKAWRDLDMPATFETGFLQRFASLLKPADHKWRLDSVLIDEIRWTATRTERAALARRVIPLLPEAGRKTAEARLAVFLKAGNAAALMAAVPDDSAAGAARDWGLAFHRIQLLRRAERWDDAWKLLKQAPTEADKIVSPDDWWEERRLNAYAALRQGQPQLAYELVRYAGPLSVNPLKEQSFLAAWIALRHLDSPKTALVHLATMQGAADGPLSRAKAAYWSGRAQEALADPAAARKLYEVAAREIDTFHGQLARQKLNPAPQALPTSTAPRPSADSAQRFVGHTAVRATVLAHKAGLPREIVRIFLANLRKVDGTPAGLAMGAHLAEALDDTQMALRIGKTAVAQGVHLLYYAYPVHPFPAYTPLRPPPETALLLAIARQESEFSTSTVSGAGARGLLQVMPITAQHVCRDYKIKCQIDKLTVDRPYNATLASAYIGDRMAEFAGSYVLTLAGYNAGPGRARQWMREFGDPRDRAVDPIDWIERIPFQETREYVAKVLSNLQIYRSRLGEGDRALRLAQDLERARQPASGRGTVGTGNTPASGGG